MEQAINEYYENKIRLMKAVRKMDHRIRKVNRNKIKYLYYAYHKQKDFIIKELRKLDKILVNISGKIECQKRKLYK